MEQDVSLKNSRSVTQQREKTTGHMEEPEMENSRAAPVHCTAERGEPLQMLGGS